MGAFTENNPRIPERSKIKALYEQQLAGHKSVLQLLVREIRQILEQQGLTPAIKYRVKSFDAYFDKVRKQNAAASSKRTLTISDFFGLRIVCPFLEDIETVSALLAGHFDVVEIEHKAGQHSFREFGYDSVHLAIRLPVRPSGRPMPGVRRVCEIQLRTILQDAWAEVEHELVYKSDIPLPNQSIRRKLASLNATLTLSDLIFQEIRDYQKEIRQHRNKRRASVEQQESGPQVITFAHTATVVPGRVGPIPSSMASKLEKTMLQALTAHSGHDLEMAITLYGQLLAMRIDQKLRGLIYNHRGMAYFAQGQHQQALQDFSRAIRYSPKNDRCYANRGLCYRVLRKFQRALKDFNQAVSINPASPDNFFGRAQTYHDMQRYPQALHDCQTALSIQSGYQPARDLLEVLQSSSV